jgi:S-adenosylmethionine:tRNA ribosyltransferase-isomerase
MPIQTIDFDYYLPLQNIAQTPANPRESAKLMVIQKNTGTIEHRHISDIADYFQRGDVVVVNNSKVFHARLRGTVNGTSVEIFLVRPITRYSWLALGKPGKKIIPGSVVTIAQDFIAQIERKNPDGTLRINFGSTPGEVIKKANIYGEVPIPPYIKTIPKDRDYQTVYAKHVGSVAAPTAGFHLTENILSELEQKGVTILEITLHVGLGTFMPIKSAMIDTHAMHSEWAEISESTAKTIRDAKKNKKRIIAIGTTSVRTLEGVASLHNNGQLEAFRGDINIFIKPGFRFHIIDGMLTNFHLPKSTLIVLVSAFAGREMTLHAYKEAVMHDYRFYSFGDAMLIL